MNGIDLLAKFRDSRSEVAFGELVRRYTNLVYSVANRRLSNVSLAQEVAQIVFIKLAKAAPKLSGEGDLVAWLHRAAVNASIDLWRSESRRRAREEHALTMQAEPAEDVAWNELAPVLDEALNELNAADRQAILLRFFNEQTMRAVGEAFGVSEDAAKMRVSRALERLRSGLIDRGVTCTAVALGAMLSERAIEAAPAQLASALAALTFSAPAGVGGGAAIVSTLLQFSKLKLVSALVVLLIGGVAAVILIHSNERSRQAALAEISATNGRNQAADQNQSSSSPVTQEGAATEDGREPDPLKLLQAVARARERIHSGSMEFHVWIDRFEPTRKETNFLRLIARFDDQRVRFESFGREYYYVGRGEEGAQAADAKVKEQNMDREAAVRAGLLGSFEAHDVTATDGITLLKYRETDGKSGDATINDASKGSASFMFNPRCLGLRNHLFPDSTVEHCLGYLEAKAINLIGKEVVDTALAWHVHVLSKYSESLDFWIDVAHPERIVKTANGANVVTSKYENTGAIPAEISTMEYRSGALSFSQRIVQFNARYNVSVDPSLCTLAGLGMAVGSPVVDLRLHRRIAVSGTGLAAALPSYPQRKEFNRNRLPTLANSSPSSTMSRPLIMRSTQAPGSFLIHPTDRRLKKPPP